MHLVIVILGVLLFPKDLSALKCYKCTEVGATGTGTCNNSVYCSDSECGAVTTRTYVGEITMDVKIKTCLLSAGCGDSGSINFGISRGVVSSKCCSTDLCNAQYPTPPARPSDLPNGNKCYTCNGNDCSDILSCAGDEDRCITQRVEVKGNAMTYKGCISKSLCASLDTPQSPHSILGVTVEAIGCCEGDLCNSATSTAVSILSTQAVSLLATQETVTATQPTQGTATEPTLGPKTRTTQEMVTATQPTQDLSALKCYKCTEVGATGTGTCNNSVYCSDSECGAVTTRTYVGEITMDVKIKSCVLSAACGNSGSINLGISRSVVSNKCCSTDLCNVQYPTPPARPSDLPNGKKCYTCNGNDCSDILSCAGDEDRCITQQVEVKGNAMTYKGCVSKSLCASLDTRRSPYSILGVTVEAIGCCEGDLCNSATSTAVSLGAPASNGISVLKRGKSGAIRPFNRLSRPRRYSGAQ